ncbi:MAG: hypothetical protein AB1749_04180 [Pseudomonadota bacterium]
MSSLYSLADLISSLAVAVAGLVGAARAERPSNPSPRIAVGEDTTGDRSIGEC